MPIFSPIYIYCKQDTQMFRKPMHYHRGLRELLFRKSCTDQVFCYIMHRVLVSNYLELQPEF